MEIQLRLMKSFFSILRQSKPHAPILHAWSARIKCWEKMCVTSARHVSLSLYCALSIARALSFFLPVAPPPPSYRHARLFFFYFLASSSYLLPLILSAPLSCPPLVLPRPWLSSSPGGTTSANALYTYRTPSNRLFALMRTKRFIIDG